MHIGLKYLLAAEMDIELLDRKANRNLLRSSQSQLRTQMSVVSEIIHLNCTTSISGVQDVSGLVNGNLLQNF